MVVSSTNDLEAAPIFYDDDDEDDEPRGPQPNMTTVPQQTLTSVPQPNLTSFNARVPPHPSVRFPLHATVHHQERQDTQRRPQDMQGTGPGVDHPHNHHNRQHQHHHQHHQQYRSPSQHEHHAHHAQHGGIQSPPRRQEGNVEIPHSEVPPQPSEESWGQQYHKRPMPQESPRPNKRRIGERNHDDHSNSGAFDGSGYQHADISSYQHLDSSQQGSVDISSYRHVDSSQQGSVDISSYQHVDSSQGSVDISSYEHVGSSQQGSVGVQSSTKAPVSSNLQSISSTPQSRALGYHEGFPHVAPTTSTTRVTTTAQSISSTPQSRALGYHEGFPHVAPTTSTTRVTTTAQTSASPLSRPASSIAPSTSTFTVPTQAFPPTAGAQADQGPHHTPNFPVDTPRGKTPPSDSRVSWDCTCGIANAITRLSCWTCGKPKTKQTGRTTQPPQPQGGSQEAAQGSYDEQANLQPRPSATPTTTPTSRDHGHGATRIPIQASYNGQVSLDAQDTINRIKDTISRLQEDNTQEANKKHRNSSMWGGDERQMSSIDQQATIDARQTLDALKPHFGQAFGISSNPRLEPPQPVAQQAPMPSNQGGHFGQPFGIISDAGQHSAPQQSIGDQTRTPSNLEPVFVGDQKSHADGAHFRRPHASDAGPKLVAKPPPLPTDLGPVFVGDLGPQSSGGRPFGATVDVSQSLGPQTGAKPLPMPSELGPVFVGDRMPRTEGAQLEQPPFPERKPLAPPRPTSMPLQQPATLFPPMPAPAPSDIPPRPRPPRKATIQDSFSNPPGKPNVAPRDPLPSTPQPKAPPVPITYNPPPPVREPPTVSPLVQSFEDAQLQVQPFLL